MDEYAKHNEKYKVLYILRTDTIVCFVWTAKSGHWWELEGILFGIQNPQDIHTPLVCSIQKGRLNLRGLSLAGDFSSNQIIMSKYEAVMVEQQFDDCLLCRAFADTNDILFF